MGQQLDWPFLPADQPAWNRRGDEPWDYQTQGFTGEGNHEGRDYGLAQGAPYYASADGTVVDHQIGWIGGGGGGWGTHLVIDYGDDIQIRTAHMATTTVGLGDRVRRGQIIGHSGNTGRSSGPHLHLEVRRGFRRGGARGTVLDPASMLTWPSGATPVPPEPDQPDDQNEDEMTPEDWKRFDERLEQVAAADRLHMAAIADQRAAIVIEAVVRAIDSAATEEEVTRKRDELLAVVLPRLGEIDAELEKLKD